MARKDSPTIVQEDLYPPEVERVRAPRHAVHSAVHNEDPREHIEDARLVDLDVNEQSPFLRGQKRVSARRSTLPKKTASRLLWAALALVILCVGAVGATFLYNYGEHSWRFRVESSDNIEVTGMQNVTKAQIMEVMGADIGRNIFFIPLAQQKVQLEQIPWVESASVMRFVPNRLKVEVHERTPVAFARVGPRIFLIDAAGTLMDLPHNHKYSFPVILGMNPGEPLSTRAPRMKAYNDLVRQLDSDGARYSQDLSEVDLSDLDDLKVRVNDPAGDVLVELGSSEYLKRFKTYTSHVREWRQQFQKLESVNLRYDNQVIVNPEIEGKPEGKPKPPVISAATVKAAAVAGVKPAALIQPLPAHDKTLPKPVFELSQQTLQQNNAKKAAIKIAGAKTPEARAATTKPAAATIAMTKPATKKPAAKKPAAKTKWKRGARKSAHASGSKPVASASASTSKKPAAAKKPAATGTSPTPSAAIAKQQANASD